MPVTTLNMPTVRVDSLVRVIIFSAAPCRVRDRVARQNPLWRAVAIAGTIGGDHLLWLIQHLKAAGRGDLAGRVA